MTSASQQTQAAACRLELYGFRVLLRSDQPSILGDLRRDFSFFSEGSDREPGNGSACRITLHLARPDLGGLRASRTLWCNANCAVYEEGSRRIADYHGKALGIYDLDREEGSLWSEDPDLLHELAYLLILSRAGEWLDRRGLYRIHALGFAYKGEGALILLPPGGGKTTLALELLKVPEVRLLSEDTPLIDSSGRVHPFPLRLGACPDEPALAEIPLSHQRRFIRRQFGPKVLIDLDCFGPDRISGPVPLRWLFVGSRRLGENLRIEPLSRWKALGALFIHCVLGWGIPQVVEYRLPARPLKLLGLVRILLGRAVCGTALLWKARPYRLLLGTDRSLNAESLLASLSGSPQ